LSIHKSKQPDVVAALKDALDVLLVLKPENCNNPETLGLYGAIHKRLREINPAPELQDIGITAYARLAFGLSAITQTERTKRLWRPKARAILGFRLLFLSVSHAPTLSRGPAGRL